MKIYTFWMALLAFLIAGLGYGGTLKDPNWLISDKPMADLFWMQFAVCDTYRAIDLNRVYPTDTGDKFDSMYVNLNYQFTTDTIIFMHPSCLDPF